MPSARSSRTPPDFVKRTRRGVGPISIRDRRIGRDRPRSNRAGQRPIARDDTPRIGHFGGPPLYDPPERPARRPGSLARSGQRRNQATASSWSTRKDRSLPKARVFSLLTVLGATPQRSAISAGVIAGEGRSDQVGLSGGSSAAIESPRPRASDQSFVEPGAGLGRVPRDRRRASGSSARAGHASWWRRSPGRSRAPRSSPELKTSRMPVRPTSAARVSKPPRPRFVKQAQIDRLGAVIVLVGRQAGAGPGPAEVAVELIQAPTDRLGIGAVAGRDQLGDLREPQRRIPGDGVDRRVRRRVDRRLGRPEAPLIRRHGHCDRRQSAQEPEGLEPLDLRAIPPSRCSRAFVAQRPVLPSPSGTSARSASLGTRSGDRSRRAGRRPTRSPLILSKLRDAARSKKSDLRGDFRPRVHALMNCRSPECPGQVDRFAAAPSECNRS